MNRNPFQSTAPMILPSILSADFMKLGADVDDVLRGGADLIHVDVMDGHLVPNISVGVPVVASLRKGTQAYLDVHLMIDEPVRYAPAFAKAGADCITFHVEATPDPAAAAKEIRKLGRHVGITLKPGTPVESIWPAMDHVDLILIMSVEPGFGGQKFMADQLPKVQAVKQRLRPNQRIEIDGGMNNDTIGIARAAGVDWFVIGSSIFDQKDRAGAIAELRKRIIAGQ
ncbi:MAG: ribulose-phosphate 3-epimerase [Tepidisphaeraceae bacterium]